MPILVNVLSPGNTGGGVKELHEQLSAVGAVLDPGEQAAIRFGPSTAAAVRTFRERHGLPAGMVVDRPAARLMHAASAFAGPGGRAALAQAVRELAAAPGDAEPQELYWTARYAILAGDYATAGSIAAQIAGHVDVQALIDPILALPEALDPPTGLPPAAPQSPNPAIPFPENFYSYRRDLYPSGLLEEMQREVARVAQPPRSANQAFPGSGAEGAAMIRDAVAWFEAVRQWQAGNAASNHRNFKVAQAAYDSCQSAICDYFGLHYSINLGTGPLADRLTKLIKHIGKEEAAFASLWSRIRWRRSLLSLDELRAWDWPDQPPTLEIARLFNPSPLVGTLPLLPDHGLGFVQKYFSRGEFGEEPAVLNARQNDLEAPLITLAFVLVPLARAEANRARRHFDAAIRDLRFVLDSVLIRRIPPTPANPGPFRNVFARIACEFIELPFARLLLAETLLDKGDTEYRARIAADPSPAEDVSDFQGLKAAQTYLAIKAEFKKDKNLAYVARVDAGRDALTERIGERLAAKDRRDSAFRRLGNDMTVPTLKAFSGSLPGLDRRAKGLEPLLKFEPPAGETVLRERNPRVYAVLLSATARLEQLRAGFNYLGYLDSYVPPWRFQFLLERARYFANNARNGQRDYLNFLSNAEREDLQELSASQGVQTEKSNIRIETARVDQAGAEVASALASQAMSALVAENAAARLEGYSDMATKLQEMEQSASAWAVVGGFIGVVVSIAAIVASGGALAPVAVGATAAWIKAMKDGETASSVAGMQRHYEMTNLGLAMLEANQAAAVAGAQVDVARAGLVVDGLQRQAALLRHEFALQTLQYMRDRILSAEQWFRLAAGVRSVGETYLRYAVELAFLAEQAYEFEADKRINAIRFDYDLGEAGDFLAADFLLRDLDTLEQDLVVTRRQRQQHVRYVLSMAREFPEALQEVRDRGRTTFSLRLEQIERRFPGLYNVRIGTVEILPVALMDSARFSLELAHLGTSQIRLKAQPDTPVGEQSVSPLNVNDLAVPANGWLAGLQEAWPIKLNVTSPETSLFSGLTAQDANATFAFATAGQRHAFESVGAASAWRVDFTAPENQVVPGTIADLLITFTLSGYHDGELRAAIDALKPRTDVRTLFLSGRQTFPDAYYEFHRTGRMAWRVPREMLTLTGELGTLRNIGMSLRPGRPEVNFSRLVTQLRVDLRIDEAGGAASGVTVLTSVPAISVTQTAPLTVAVSARLDDASELVWDFGDGTPVLRTLAASGETLASAEGSHVYSRPGRFVIKLRCVRNGALSEFRIGITMSRERTLPSPLLVTPAQISFDASSKMLTVAAIGGEEAGSILWRIGDSVAEGAAASFVLEPGRYSLGLTAVRALSFRAYGNQRHGADLDPLPLRGFGAATNRSFDGEGRETNGTGTPPLPARNNLAERLFGAGPISPEDEWVFELDAEEISGAPGPGSISRDELDLEGIQDVVLSLEFEAIETGPGEGG